MSSPNKCASEGELTSQQEYFNCMETHIGQSFAGGVAWQAGEGGVAWKAGRALLQLLAKQ